ncbi:MAG TPA: ammonium transporter [Dehalococcoidia bacterium]|nr:ammonium transporter [Dehalococcoidia bacterium]
MPIDSGNTAWVLAASALVLLMTPALGFFYGGFTRNKNVLGTIMQSFIVAGLIGVQWVVIGYTLAFGPDHWGLIGGLDWFGLRHVGGEVAAYTHNGAPRTYGVAIPHEAFMIFQAMFAIITPALITGAFAERAKFSTFLVFMLLWSFLVYDPVAHWVFANDGWLSLAGTQIKALDFAGGTAIHVNAGAAALAAAFVFGRRKGFKEEPMEPHDVTMIVLGAALLWFGWFGFNAGSAGAANAQAVNAFVVTNTAAASAALAWTFMSWWISGKPSVVGAAAGAVAGLVAITPASGFVQPMESIGIGAIAGILCFLAVQWRTRTSIDDSLDVVGVHGVGGLWGSIATGLFATAAVGGVNGLFHGAGDQLWRQLVATGVVAVYSFGVTFVLLKVLDATLGLRVSEEDEVAGLDVSQHGERAYVFGGSGPVLGIPEAIPMHTTAAGVATGAEHLMPTTPGAAR